MLLYGFKNNSVWRSLPFLLLLGAAPLKPRGTDGSERYACLGGGGGQRRGKEHQVKPALRACSMTFRTQTTGALH